MNWLRKRLPAGLAAISLMIGFVIVSTVSAFTSAATVKFNNFRYKADWGGKPISENQQAPPGPDLNVSDFYDRLAKMPSQQMRVNNFSGDRHCDIQALQRLALDIK